MKHTHINKSTDVVPTKICGRPHVLFYGVLAALFALQTITIVLVLNAGGKAKTAEYFDVDGCSPLHSHNPKLRLSPDRCQPGPASLKQKV